MSDRIVPEHCWEASLVPGVEPSVSEAPLHLIEWGLLWVIHADLRLTERYHRDRLSTLMAALDPALSHAGRIGVALSRVRDLAMAGALQTRVFVNARERPVSVLGEAAFVATLRAFARHNSSSDKIQTLREPFLRWLGVLPDPEKCGDLKERSNVDAEEGS